MLGQINSIPEFSDETNVESVNEIFEDEIDNIAENDVGISAEMAYALAKALDD